MALPQLERTCAVLCYIGEQEQVTPDHNGRKAVARKKSLV